jgi:hypothetical protein
VAAWALVASCPEYRSGEVSVRAVAAQQAGGQPGANPCDVTSDGLGAAQIHIARVAGRRQMPAVADDLRRYQGDYKG